MARKRGSDAAGGGLRARVSAWEALPGAAVAPGRKHASGHDPGNRQYIKPGSQNARKGGRGRE